MFCDLNQPLAHLDMCLGLMFCWNIHRIGIFFIMEAWWSYIFKLCNDSFYKKNLTDTAVRKASPNHNSSTTMNHGLFRVSLASGCRKNLKASLENKLYVFASLYIILRHYSNGSVFSWWCLAVQRSKIHLIQVLFDKDNKSTYQYLYLLEMHGFLQIVIIYNKESWF